MKCSLKFEFLMRYMLFHLIDPITVTGGFVNISCFDTSCNYSMLKIWHQVVRSLDEMSNWKHAKRALYLQAAFVASKVKDSHSDRKLPKHSFSRVELIQFEGHVRCGHKPIQPKIKWFVCEHTSDNCCLLLKVLSPFIFFW